MMAAGAVVVLSLTACGSGAADDQDNGAISVVSSTNVYGDIAETIGGGHVEVTPIIDSLSQDPHSYEATVRDKLEVSKAELIIGNGGGYDAFLHRLVEDTAGNQRTAINAVELSGLRPDNDAADDGNEEHGAQGSGHDNEDAGDHAGHSHGDFNEHVWYSLSTVSAVAEETANRLAQLDSANAADYEANAAEFTASVKGLQEQLKGIENRHGGEGVAITEPVPLHLLNEAGLINKTPPEFSQAVEEGNGASPVVLRETLQLFTKNKVAFLAYNEQTEGTQTQTVRDSAAGSGVPVVNFTETLPEGSDYLQWMQENVDNIERALAQ